MTVMLGNQLPTYTWAPEWTTTAGIEAVQFSAANGLVLDPWQQNILNDALAEDPDTGKWQNNECGIIVGRQNGKGSIIEARTLAGLFLFGEKLILHSAHQQKTSNDAFNRLLTIVQSNADLDRRVVAISRSKGEEGITFRIDGKQHRVRYMTRTGSAGRGLTKADLIFLDEAMILDEGPIAALLPTMATMPNWQVFYTASAGDRRLPTGSRVLARVRRRGLARERGLTLHMWEAHLKHTDTCAEDCRTDRRDDERTWAKTNPTYNVRRADGTQGIETSFLRKMIKGMASWDFDREFLGVGDYPADEGWNVFSEELWTAMQATDDELREIQFEGAPRPFTVGIESTWDRESTSISIVAQRPDGRWHWETVKTAAGLAWAVDYCVAMKAKRPVAFAIDPKGPSAQIIPDLEAATFDNGRPARLTLFQPTLPQFMTASAKVLSIVMETQGAVHLGQDPLTDAVRLVEKRELGQGQFAWQRIDAAGDVSPIIGVTLAMAGHIALGVKRRRRPLVGAA